MQLLFQYLKHYKLLIALALLLAAINQIFSLLDPYIFQHIIDNYSLEKAAARWERFFEALLAEAGPRRPIQIPRHFDLPPVHPALAREDVRRSTVYTRMWERSRRLAAHGARRLLNR